jgi:VWFA-related protein
MKLGKIATLFGSTAVFLFAVLLAMPPSVGAQEEAEEAVEEDEGFFETVEVNVVNVEVFVTDKKGNPVTGLTVDDFEVYEDKRPIAITNFYAVEDRQPVAARAVPSEDVGEPEAAPTPPTIPLFEEQSQLSLIVYIDNFNIRPFNRNRVFRRLREFLREQIRDGDRVMLVTYNRSLKVPQPFTTNMALINSALFDMEDHSGHGVHADSERRRVYETITNAEDVTDAMLEIRPWVESMYNDLSFTVGALDDMVDSLAGLPGRKALLYVSDGLSMKPGEEYFYLIQQKFHYSSVMTEIMNYDMSRDFRRLSDRANSNRVTFYTIDAGGLRTFSQSDVQMAGAGDPGMGTFVDSIYIQNLQEPLRFLAEATGGFAIINTNDVGEDLDKLGADFNTYYSLGYTPAHQGDGRLHRIEVKVKGRKGLRIRHRTSYRDKPVGAQMVDATLSALRYGFESNSMGLMLEVGSGEARQDGLFVVPIKVGIPLDSLVLVPRTGHYYARTRLYFGAIDEKESVSEVSDVALPIQIPEDQIEGAKGKYFPYTTSLLMRRGPHQIAVGLRDELGANSSYIKKTFFVGG